jgi:hypothetical protein
LFFSVNRNAPSADKSQQPTCSLQQLLDQIARAASIVDCDLQTPAVIPTPRIQGPQPQKVQNTSNKILKYDPAGSLANAALLVLNDHNDPNTDKLTKLEQLVHENNKLTTLKRDKLVKSQHLAVSVNRLQSLQSLCDVIRANCLASNGCNSLKAFGSRTSFPLREMTKQLAVDMRTPESELLIRIKLLAEIVPHFVTLIAPDAIVHVTTIKLNMDAIYQDVRQRLTKTVMDRVTELQASINGAV